MSEIHKTTRRNMLVYFAAAILYTLSTNFLAEGYIQSYLIELGLDTRQLGVYGTVSTLAALAAYAVFSFCKPKRMRTYVDLMLFTGLLACLFPPVLIATNLLELPFFALYIGIAIYQLSMAVRCSCEYSAIPMLYPRREYGNASARCGMIGSAIAAVLSLASAALAGIEKLTLYTGFFAVATVALLFSALVVRLYRPVEALISAEESSTASSRMDLKQSITVLLPHFLRGTATAFFYYFVSTGMRNITLTSTGQSIFVSLGIIGTMAACFLFMKLQARFRTGVIILISNIICAASAVAVCFCRSQWSFFALYMLYMLSLNVTAYAIPAGVIYSTSAGNLPFISSMRMFLMSGATCLLLTPVASLLSAIPAWQVMSIGGAAFILCGALFFRIFHDKLKN